jgi:DNA-binding IclR family transcriptional regulator
MCALHSCSIRRGLRPYTPHTVTSPDLFRRALAVTRLTGVTVTRGELEVGTCGVAVPVFGPGGELVASIELAVRVAGAPSQLSHRSAGRNISLSRSASLQVVQAMRPGER